MKKSTQIIATVLFLFLGNFVFSQNDSMYVVKGGVVLGKYAIANVDSVIFYNPDSTTSSDTTVVGEASIVGVWTPTSIYVEVSIILTEDGMIMEETDSNYTMHPSDPDWPITEMEFTDDGFYVENGDTIDTYTHSGELLTFFNNEEEEEEEEEEEDDDEEEDDEDITLVCTVTSTNIVLIQEATEINSQVTEGVDIIETITTKMIINGTRK